MVLRERKCLGFAIQYWKATLVMVVSESRWIATILIDFTPHRPCWLTRCMPSPPQLTPPYNSTSWGTNSHSGVCSPQSLPTAVRTVVPIVSFASRSLYDGGVCSSRSHSCSRVAFFPVRVITLVDIPTKHQILVAPPPPRPGLPACSLRCTFSNLATSIAAIIATHTHSRNSR